MPTPENVNALPDGVRQYVHDLETRCDPAGDVAALTLQRDQIRLLEALVRRLRDRGDFSIGSYTLRLGAQKGRIWIEAPSGEGGDFRPEQLEQAIAKFFAEYF